MYRDEWLFSIYMILLRDFVPEWNSRSSVEIRVTSRRHGISGGVMWTNSEAQERNKMNSLQHESRLGILNAISEFRSEVITTLTLRKDGVFACGLIRENEDSKMSISPNNSCFCGQTKEQGFLFLVFFFFLPVFLARSKLLKFGLSLLWKPSKTLPVEAHAEYEWKN